MHCPKPQAGGMRPKVAGAEQMLLPAHCPPCQALSSSLLSEMETFTRTNLAFVLQNTPALGLGLLGF